MRKKVLFIIGTLQSGGVSKSMVNLLNAFDRQRYDVHLLLLSREGDVFSRYLPEGVTLHVNQDIEDLHGGFRGVIRLFKRFRLFLAFGSLLRMVLSRFDRARAGLLMAQLMPRFTDEEFDLIVDYGGQQQLYYMVDKLKGEKKVTFFHSDYDKWPYYYKADKKYYPRTDAIFTVSPTSVESMKKWFPNCSDGIYLMENISVPHTMKQLAEEVIHLPVHNYFFVTIGHIWKNKGIDFAIEAAEILKREKIDFLWAFIGKVIEPQWLEIIEEKGLNGYFLFTGILSNPYPYLKACDIYVHPSRFEGKSIALDEAKILCKPIVVTRFSTVNDQFEDRINASIAEMNGADVAEKIMELIDTPSLRASYTDYLAAHVTDNSDEVEKLYQFLEN